MLSFTILHELMGPRIRGTMRLHRSMLLQPGDRKINNTPVLCRHLNILGGLVAMVAIVFLGVYFNTEAGPESAYFLGGSFTCFVISILSFGFSKIIELLINK